jgi:carbohydrate diacid regulator
MLFRATELGYDLTLPRVVVILDVGAPTEAGEANGTSGASGHQHGPSPSRDVSILRSELLRAIREVFPDPQDVVTSMASGRFAVLHRVPQRHVHQQETAATATCHRAVEAIDLLHHGLAARAAVGDVATSVAGLHDSYRDACDALRLGARVAKDLPVHTIGDLRIHQVLAAVGHRTRAHLVDLVVGPLRAQPDWPVLRRTIVAWCEHGFNLVRASAALYIHRNTLVYRLGRSRTWAGGPCATTAPAWRCTSPASPTNSTSWIDQGNPQWRRARPDQPLREEPRPQRRDSYCVRLGAPLSPYSF